MFKIEKIVIELELSDNHEVLEYKHYILLGNIKIKIDNLQIDFKKNCDNSSLQEYYLELVNARTEYMLKILIEIEKEKILLLDKYDFSQPISSISYPHIIEFFVKSEKLKKSMNDICKLSFNNAYQLMHNKYVVDNTPKVIFQNDEADKDEEEA